MYPVPMCISSGTCQMYPPNSYFTPAKSLASPVAQCNSSGPSVHWGFYSRPSTFVKRTAPNAACCAHCAAYKRQPCRNTAF